MKRFLQNYHKQLVLIFLLLLTSVYSFIAVASHNHFLTFGWDLGYFDQLIWKVSRGIYPLSDLSKVNLLSGHFAPILYLFAPLYYIWSDPRMLLITQAFLMVLAALPLYLLAVYKTDNKIFSFTVMLTYLFFIGTQWSILNEFHEATVIPLFLSLIFYSLEKNKRILFWIAIIGTLLVKEEMALLISALGLTIFFYFKKRKLGLSLTVFSLLFFFIITELFIPAISEKGTLFHPYISPDAKTPSEFVTKIVTNPLYALQSLITPPDKIKTLMLSFLSFGLLPLFAPFAILLPVIEQFLMRFIYTGPQYTVWLNVNHHAAPIAILLPIACIYGSKMLINSYKYRKQQIFITLSIILMVSTIMQDILLKAPIHSILKKQLYEISSWMEDDRMIIRELKRLSPNGSIAVQNNLYPHLSQRENIYLLPELDDAEYLAIDFHNGPNKYAPLQYEQMVEFINKLITDGQFTIYKKQGEAVILERKRL